MSSTNATCVQRSSKNNRHKVINGGNASDGKCINDSDPSERFPAASRVLMLTMIVAAVVYIAAPDESILVNVENFTRYLASKLHLKRETTNEKYLATIDQHFAGISLHEVNCSYNGYKEERILEAAPLRCGTIISDTVVTISEAIRLREMASKLTGKIGTSSAKERESLNLKWVELYNVFRRGPPEGVFTKKDYHLLLKTSEAAKARTALFKTLIYCHAVSVMFGVPSDKLYFSHISEFTRYKPMIKFSEFLHIDKIRAPALVITAIVWLSTVDQDFRGGHLEFLTGGPEPFTPLLIEPKLGRFAAWTSSYENPHGVREVYAGERLALVLGFTVFPKDGHETLEDMFDIAMANYESV